MTHTVREMYPTPLNAEDEFDFSLSLLLHIACDATQERHHRNLGFASASSEMA